MSASPTPDLNGTGNLKTTSADTHVSDEKMDQIRELLFGDFAKQSELRVAALEARVRELEGALQQRLDALEGRLEAVSREIGAEQSRSFDEIARGVMELGEHIKRIRSE